MIEPIQRQEVLDLSSDRLPPLWWRKAPTLPESRELVAPGVWRTGPMGVFRSRMVQAIEDARRVVLIASFLLADAALAEAILGATKRNVRVYLLTASEQRLAKAPEDDELFEKKMIEEHKALLARLAGRTLLRSAEHFHAKFLVVDPPGCQGGQPRAFLSTANFNKALVDSVEIGVELDPALVAALAGTFSMAFWTEAERELAEAGRLAAVGPAPAVPKEAPHPSLFTTTRTSTSLKSEVLRLIGSARRELLVSSYGFEKDHPSVQALCDAARRGVTVRVVTRSRPQALPALLALAEAGVQVKAHEKLHAKAIVADGSALLMTANLETQGLDRGFEVGVRLEEPKGKAVQGILADWFSSFPLEFHAAPCRGDILGEVYLARQRAREGRAEVVAEESATLPPVTAESALELDAAPKPSFANLTFGARHPRRVRVSWEVRPPSVPQGAREKKRPVQRKEIDKDGNEKTRTEQVAYEPPVFEHGGRLFVKLRTPADLGPARRLASELKAVVAL